MTLRVWRDKKTRLHAECTACGSYGTAGHVEVKRRLDPDIQEALDRHEAKMLAYREHFKTAANAVVRKIHDGSLPSADGANQIRAIQESFMGQILLANASLPNPEGKVAYFVSKCPWCDIVEDVDIVQLPDDVAEPDFELAKPVAAQLARGA